MGACSAAAGHVAPDNVLGMYDASVAELLRCLPEEFRQAHGRRLSESTSGGWLIAFNDGYAASKEDVLALFDAALKKDEVLTMLDEGLKEE